MNDLRVINLTVIGGIPVIPDADVEEEDGNLFIAYRRLWKTGGAHKRSRGPDEVLAYLKQIPGTNDFRVFADPTSWATIDPDNKGKTLKDYGPDKMDWKCEGTRDGKPFVCVITIASKPKDDASPSSPWTSANVAGLPTGIIITKATPTVDGEIYGSGMADTIEKEPYKAL
jgi:hypothetical protein